MNLAGTVDTRPKLMHPFGVGGGEVGEQLRGGKPLAHNLGNPCCEKGMHTRSCAF